MPEDEDHEPVGRADREQVEHDRRRRDRRSSGRRPSAARSSGPSTNSEHDRQPLVHRVDEVDVVGRVAADHHVRVRPAERLRDQRRAETPDRVERRLPGLVAADLNADRGQRRPSGVETQVAAPEDGVAARARSAAARSRRAPRASARSRRPRPAPGSSSPAGSSALSASKPCFDSSRSGSVLTPLAPRLRPSAGTATATRSAVNATRLAGPAGA